MFKNIFKTVLLMTIFAATQAYALTLPEIVSSARRGAVDAFTPLAYYKFQNTPLTNDEIHWLVLYRSELANDAASVKHSWNVGNHQECAWTRVEKGAAIDFSQNQCESVIFSSQQALPILIQMSLIHFGVSQQRAYVMSQVILSIAGSPALPPPTQPNPALDVFSPSICNGPEISPAEMISYFMPGAVNVTPEFKSKKYTRQRTCNLVTGCAPWDVKEFDLPSDQGGRFFPELYINSSGQPTYKFYLSASGLRYDSLFYFTVPNYYELGLQEIYSSLKVGPQLLTNKCGYSKTYFVTPKSNKGSFVEFEMVFFGLLGAPKK